MYFTEALRVLLRRWYILLVGMFALAAAALGVIQWVPTTYQASGQLLLVLPVQAPGVDAPLNPYLNLQSGLSTTAAIIASSISSKDTQAELAKQGYTATYSAEVLPGAGPILVITTKSTSPKIALGTRDQVIERLNNKLSSIQTELDVPKTQVIGSLPTNIDKRAEVLPGSKIKAMIGVGAGIVVLTLVITFLFDGWRRARTLRLGRGAGAAPETLSAEADLPPERPRVRANGVMVPANEGPRRKSIRARNQGKPVKRATGPRPERGRR